MPTRGRGDDVVTMNHQEGEARDQSSALWAVYKHEGRQDQRDQLIVHYSPLVKYVAGRVAIGLPQNVDQADLVSYGIFGLIDAIEKFDPQRGYKFETYAIARIKGNILDELRAIDWVPRVGAGQGAGASRRRTPGSRAELHRTPTEQELAAELDVTDDQLQATLSQISFVGLLALDEMLRLGRAGRVDDPGRHARRPGPRARRRLRGRGDPPAPRRGHRTAPGAGEGRARASTTTKVSRWPRSARSSV